MPILDLGYRPWKGRLSPEALRWCVITETVVRLAWQNRWVRRILFITWIPAVYMAAGFFAYEQYLMNAHDAQGFIEDMLPGAPVTGDRHQTWAWLLMTFFRYPQAMLMLLVVGLIAPPLVAQDVRSRAFLLYFSRPITRIEYLFGKLAAVWAYLLMITTAPALALYAFAVLLSPDFSVLAETWDLPFRIAGASAVLLIPTTTLALAFSSMSSETRYAGFAWFATWVFGWVTYGFISALPSHTHSELWTLVSLYHTLGEVQNWVFGIGDASPVVVWSAVLLSGISIVSLATVYRRISAPMRV